MRKFAAFLIFVFSFCAFAIGQAEPVETAPKEFKLPNSEVFGGYEYEHADLSGNSATTGFVLPSSTNLHGFDIEFSHYFGGFLQGKVGLTAEVARATKKSIDITGDGIVRTSFMGGPTIRLHRYGFFSPSLHVLGGVDRQTLNVVPTGSSATLHFENTDFAIAGGGTLDGNLSRHLAVRLAQVDYLYTNHYNTGQSSFRYTGGIVLRF